MKPAWKEIYPWIKAALLNLESVDSLLRQVVEQISSSYEAECLLWAGLEFGVSDALRVYGLPEIVNQYAAGLAIDPPTLATEVELFLGDRPSPIQSFLPRSLPIWLLDQQTSPQIVQLETGELLIPVTSRGTETRGISVANPLQFVLQLRRSPTQFPLAEVQLLLPSTNRQTPIVIRGWNLEELESLEVVGSHVGLAASALYWRQRLEQSRQQAALVGRISRLLNSMLNPDEIVGRIVAELGYGLQCDRSILVDLRDDPVTILAVWNYAERHLMSLEGQQIQRSYWQNIIDLFTQGGASYLQMGVNDPEPDPLQGWMQSTGVLSVLLVPLFIQEEFFGAVALLSYQQERAYLLDELQTVRQVADQAAIALTNAQNYQRLWHRQEALRMQNDSLQQKVMRDELTQLMNRRSLERELKQLSMTAAWTVQPPFSIIVCDIDYFKMVNDEHGHLVGDEVLIELAQRIQAQLRRGTLAYRYGGEEFVVILADTPMDQAIDVAERLRRAVHNRRMLTQSGELAITASFGVAHQWSAIDRSAWDVMQRADKALCEAKRKGRNRVEALDPPDLKQT